ncbi:MAG: hypothetical protein F6K55_01155 [Moorea sp. SIO4A3]|nr:hypothetical protein [Moorena sp. SIO4A3]
MNYPDLLRCSRSRSGGLWPQAWPKARSGLPAWPLATLREHGRMPQFGRTSAFWSYFFDPGVDLPGPRGG